MGLKCAKQLKKLDVFIPLALLLLCYGGGSVHCATVYESSVDLHALLEFKQGISDDPKGALSNWNTSTHFCRWYGVNCSVTRRPLHVKELNLTGQSLTGQISSSLGNLTFLNTLDLSNNNFRGPLPLLRNMQQLRTFYLYSNYLDGIIPADAFSNCSNLSYLDLSINSLTGSVPLNIGFLPSLKFLRLDDNFLTGSIPQTLGNATNLILLNLGTNQLKGSIPHELGHLTNLSRLVLNINFLSGRIPQAMLSLSSLQYLDLGTNMLSNTLPRNIGYALPKLIDLAIGGNMFEGRIPPSLGNISGLQGIDLSSNNFIGEIPSSFGNLINLTSLRLSDNMLEARESQGWEFLHALGNCNFLNTLSIQNNSLQGVIPNVIGNLSINTLEVLSLGQNNLSGTIPPSIGNFSGLIKLGLNNNYFSSTIEEWIGNLKNLQGLFLNGNNFIGQVPSFLGNLLQLTVLLLENNDLEGTVPPSLGNLKQLTMLRLSYNKLQGSIPLELTNLNGLTELQLSSNMLTDQIPDTLGQCESLQIMKIDNNFLTGDIPLSFGNLRNLKILNLSHNNMSGTIPVALSDLTLFELDLSYNDFYGDIPRNGVFANATAVTINGNKGLCGGVMNLHMPSCPSASRKTEKQYYLIRVLIPIFGFISLILLVYFVFIVRKIPRKKYFSHPSFGENFPKVSYQDLAQATRNFSESNIVGRGSCGSVYRGKLKEPELDVAVKVFNLEIRDAERSFMSECEALRSVQHRNLLPIITACSTVDSQGNIFKALVYEFMPNGNLDTWLHHKGGETSPKVLGLTQRINIAVNIADALDYLHHDCGRPTVHCDLKPSNILLDDDMNALLGDFGIARFYLDSTSTSAGSITSIGVRGTIGYIAPEYTGGGHASISGDVYSFGIVLLEMMTGKRPTDPIFKDGLDIANFVDSNCPHQIFHVIDHRLVEEYKDFPGGKSENAVYQCLVSLLEVAIACTRALPSERMNMKQAASKLNAIKTSYLGWQSKQVCTPVE